MAIQIEIQEAHADLLIDFYIERLKNLKGEIQTREKEAKEITSQILRLKKGKNTSLGLLEASFEQSGNMLMDGYSDKWPWVKKIEFAINSKDRPLTTKEIVDTLIEYEVGLMFERKKAVASISSILSTKSGQNKEFNRFENESGEFAYGLNKSNTPPPANDSSEEDLPF